ncbi:hypothetical protein [Nitrosomonas mobilis]|uniref:hypothetical protein n=1 Tax=Nitrosomonas mobilis TaxID=51642 RepID=UPI0015A4E081|nr:hypothetical protein [Nitrosomonas mobilis]HNO76106.1 hypothetical protein [Nitrosomonas mobilis]
MQTKYSDSARCTPFYSKGIAIPLNDGACEHLESMLLPNVFLWSTDDKEINLSRLPGWNVIFCYPVTGRPGFAGKDKPAWN